MNKKPLFFMLLLCSIFGGCSTEITSKYEDMQIRGIAMNQAESMSYKQTVDELLLATRNDTCKVCCVLNMSNQTLRRLTTERTYPTKKAKNSAKDFLIEYYVFGLSYIDSVYNADKEGIERLINNPANEPLNAIYENIVKQ